MYTVLIIVLLCKFLLQTVFVLFFFFFFVFFFFLALGGGGDTAQTHELRNTIEKCLVNLKITVERKLPIRN